MIKRKVILLLNRKGKKGKFVQDEEDYLPKALRKNRNSKKEEILNKEKRRKRTNKRRSKKKSKKIIGILVILVIVVMGIMMGISAHRWKALVQEMLANQNSIVMDIDGNEIAKLGCEKKNITITLSDISSDLKNAYVAIEDERFYTHRGIDIKRTGGAIASYILHFGKSSYGGSTITQQLVKNLTGDSTDSITRKVNEWWKAWQLETCLSKDKIIEAYLNIIYVGPNMYGVETGAQYYFSKLSKDLSLEECAFLAGINHSPNSYNPFEEKDNTEKISNRTKIVLAKMLELDYIDEESYHLAINNVNDGLKFKKGQIESEDAVYSYHTDALISEIIEDIAKKYHISETFATNYINMAGLTIHSNQDSKVQDTTEKEFEKSKYSLPSKNGGNSSQAAMVIIDHKTGYVVGCTGGLGEKKTARPLNRATQSVRQTGSSIKPLSVLIPAIDKKIITASSIFDDTERDFADGYHPTDYNTSLGKITIRRAVESSQNIPFVEIMEELKPNTSIQYLKKMEISTLTEDDETLVLALGGLQKGISPLQMASAYATIANDGTYIEPTFYTTIENKFGKTIVKTTQARKKVVSKEVAYIVKEILTQPVIGTHGTATYCKISGVDVAAKTGTTDENYDRWLCGFTPYYTAVTWYGYDQNESIEYNNRNPAGLLWANIMSRIHTGLNHATFEKPSAIISCKICAETGKKATTKCTDTYTEYFLWLTEPELCSRHFGSELKENTTNSTNQNKVQEVIQGITQDIDAVDPQQIPQNRNTENTMVTNTNQSSNTITNHANNSLVNNNTNRTNSNKVNTTQNTDSLNKVTNTNRTNNINNTNNITNTNSNSQNNVNV